ncbi:hypothetical protein BGZ65_002805 [Modicella reniformis]|uniref:Uncharacterized protein n=1 Tax=Modicella reniformis TaxID=1440133 RepID=A0A9P6IL79_9FUNG|nr:hypothetical protein BGZ65_002805 [Modicella reniformis]
MKSYSPITIRNCASSSSKAAAAASPRTRMHHPFDNHPSRLSPLEKQRLEYMDYEDGVEEDEDDNRDDDEDEGEDDDKETEEQRIERRRQARVAWLAKYGDAFKLHGLAV